MEPKPMPKAHSRGTKRKTSNFRMLLIKTNLKEIKNKTTNNLGKFLLKTLSKIPICLTKKMRTTKTKMRIPKLTLIPTKSISLENESSAQRNKTFIEPIFKNQETKQSHLNPFWINRKNYKPQKICLKIRIWR